MTAAMFFTEVLLWTTLGLLILVLGTVLVLFSPWIQRRLIFKFPPPYDEEKLASLNPRWQRIEASTTQGRQIAFYLPPKDGGSPEVLLVLFSGNSGKALGNSQIAEELQPDGVGFLLVDYPGYGLCEGEPCPETILESSEELFRVLARTLGIPPGRLARRTVVGGHSLGCSAALKFAAHWPVCGVHLVSPFSSLHDMADYKYPVAPKGWLQYRFENHREIRRISLRKPPPKIIIWHSADDLIVPYWMGAKLAAVAPQLIDFRSFELGAHMEILEWARPELIAELGNYRKRPRVGH